MDSPRILGVYMLLSVKWLGIRSCLEVVADWLEVGRAGKLGEVKVFKEEPKERVASLRRV